MSMLSLIQAFVQRVRDEKGQTFVEYALLIGGVSVVLIVSLAAFGPALTAFVNDIAATYF
jgi:Flp pilus assembly pilin Flp